MKPTVDEVMPILNLYLSKEGNEVGGCLHIFSDDGNVDDGNIEFCKEVATHRNDPDAVVLCDLLLRMSKTQRLKLYRNHI